MLCIYSSRGLLYENKNNGKGFLRKMNDKELKCVKSELIAELKSMLPILRAAISISQGELAEYIGVSRQTYCALEQGKRDISWNTFLSLFLFFTSNDKTKKLLETKECFLSNVYNALNYGDTIK